MGDMVMVVMEGMAMDMEAMDIMDMEAMDIMARGQLMLNLLLLLSLAMDMVMVVMEGMVMVVMEGMVMDMVAMEDMVMDMEAMDIMDTVVMDTTDKKEKYRLEFHKQCDAKSSVTSYMKLIYKESSHEFNFLYLIINK